ncbi:NADH-quinone oxidoreductase subunit C [Streptomyces tanashiensis]|uniref:NADH-quinone oxidoreductase subunit C n=1 Tax=Streptomyces tanashiensis TaxID=67367 RepID=UPI003429981F
MNRYDSLPDAVTEIFGEEATAEQAYDLLTVDVPPSTWLAALETARDTLGCTYFDWLSAVDEPGTGFRVCAHVVALGDGRPRRLLLRTTVPHDAPVLPTAIGIYAGAGWHERETHEMFGVAFEGHPHLVPLLLPENFEGHPLRKDFVLAARVAKAWPGAKEPGESHEGGGPKRRQMLPPGVPDPNEWGPLKGQLPPAPARPARAAAGDRPARAAAGDRPVRRARSVTEGSASQAAPEPGATTEGTSRPPRRTRTSADGSASQAAPEPKATESENPAAPEPGAPVRRTRSASEGSAGQAAPEPGASAEAPAAAARPPRRSRSAADGSASQTAPGPQATEPESPAGPGTAATPRTRSSDAPWHHARPAFDDKPPTPPTTEPAKPEATPAAPTDGPEPRKPGATEAPAAAEPDATEAPTTEAATSADAPASEPEAPASGPDSPAPGPDAPEPPAVGPGSGSASAHAGPADAGAPAEPPAGSGGTDNPTDPAGGDPA